MSDEFPDIRVIILSNYVEDEHIREAVRVGADGYLLKDSGVAEIELAVRSVARGHNYMSPAVLVRVMEVYKRYARGDAPPLSRRQMQVLCRISEGRNTREIAKLLGLSAKTVETHRAQLMERLGIHEVAGLVRYAIRMGLVKADWSPAAGHTAGHGIRDRDVCRGDGEREQASLLFELFDPRLHGRELVDRCGAARTGSPG